MSILSAHSHAVMEQSKTFGLGVAEESASSSLGTLNCSHMEREIVEEFAGPHSLQCVCRGPAFSCSLRNKCLKLRERKNARTERVLGYSCSSGIILTTRKNREEAE